jgi:hypothetical protein
MPFSIAYGHLIFNLIDKKNEINALFPGSSLKPQGNIARRGNFGPIARRGVQRAIVPEGGKLRRWFPFGNINASTER